MGNTVSNKLYGLDTLRDTAYADKEKSKTRLVFTLLIFGGAIAAFVILFVYKATHRATIVKTENTPDYKKYLALVDSYEASLLCSSSTATYLNDYVNFDLEAEYEDFDTLCTDAFGSDGIFYMACDDGSYNIFNAINSYKMTKGAFRTDQDIADAIYDLTIDVPITSYATGYSIWSYYSAGIQDVTSVGAIAVNDQGLLDAYLTNLANEFANDTFYDAYSVTAADWEDIMFTNEPITRNGYEYYPIDMDFEAYYKASNVISCTYTTKEGWFDVFIFAMNSSQSLFAAAVIVFGFIYSAVKYCQGRGKPSGDDELPRDSIPMDSK